MNDWPTDDRTADDLAREAAYFARVDAAEAWATEIERLALLDSIDAADLYGDDDPDAMIERHHDQWAA